MYKFLTQGVRQVAKFGLSFVVKYSDTTRNGYGGYGRDTFVSLSIKG